MGGIGFHLRAFSPRGLQKPADGFSRLLLSPDRVLPGNGEVRDIIPHLDEAQLG